MASYGQAMPMARPGQQPIPPPGVAAAGGGRHHAPYGSVPQGTFAPGTKIQVGSHRVVIQKYLSEGGFAHVYLVKLPAPVDGTDLAVLKRVAVPDKDSLRGMRTEVETMKRLKGHRAIVTYIDSHASEMRGGGYEVFLLMEYCNGGGLMDFMNTRLQHRLTEPEILAIFSDVAEGVACMHYLKPPLLHRDLKVENVLISTGASASSGSSSRSSSTRRRFKLCDFGSAAPPKPAPVSVVECRLMDEDVQKHTTLQYRSPEMIDVYRRQPIDEKSDIWALGVLLYKLCYYTTPFEDQSSQLAILNASYRFPSHPVFSDRLKSLIASMLRENQQSRPNIYQVLKEACDMQGKEVPIKDIYAGRSQSEPRNTERSHSADKPSSTPTPVVGAVFAPPAKQQQVIPDIVPMRRGRPTASSSQASAPKSNPSPMRVTNGDPFAALDSKSSKSLPSDELSARFPTLDQFSLLHDKGARFSFEETVAPSSSTAAAPDAQKPKDLNQRVAERLADDAFASSTSVKGTPQAAAAAATAAVAAGKVSPSTGISKSSTEPINPTNRPSRGINVSPERFLAPSTSPKKAPEMSRASAIISSTPELRAISAQAQQQQQPQGYGSSAPRPKMVSTGTMTSPSPTPPPQSQSSGRSQYQIYHFPASDQQQPLRTSSLPRKQYQEVGDSGDNSNELAPPAMAKSHSQSKHTRHPSSSRPSLEGGRPGLEELETPATSGPPMPTRARPASAYLESNMDYLREREGGGSGNSGRPLLSPGHPSPKYGGGDFKPSLSPRLDSSDNNRDDMPIESNVEYLRAMEESDNKRDRSQFGKQSGKRSSLTALSGTKNILAGKFGDAFKRFETNTNSGPPPARTPSPLKQLDRHDLGNRGHDGSGNYDDKYYDDVDDDNEEVLEETDDMSPEMRREIERRRLSMEEKRVAAAGAEYRQRLAQRNTGSGSGAGSSTTGLGSTGSSNNVASTPLPKSIGGVSRAVSIQNRVQSLLNESQSTANVTRTAQGYGHFIDDGSSSGPPKAGGTPSPASNHGDFDERPEVRRKPVSRSMTPSLESQRPAPGGGAPKPPAKPKPMHLNKALPLLNKGTGRSSSNSLNSNDGAAEDVYVRPGSPTASASQRPVNVGVGRGPSTVPVRGSAPTSQSQLIAMDLPGQPVLEGMTAQDKDDYIRDFTRRFPSLTTIEMVERDLAAEEQDRSR